MGPLIAYEFSRISYDMIHIDGGVILRGSVEMMEATKQCSMQKYNHYWYETRDKVNLSNN